jgi:hypothetical protein
MAAWFGGWSAPGCFWPDELGRSGDRSGGESRSADGGSEVWLSRPGRQQRLMMQNDGLQSM